MIKRISPEQSYSYLTELKTRYILDTEMLEILTLLTQIQKVCLPTILKLFFQKSWAGVKKVNKKAKHKWTIFTDSSSTKCSRVHAVISFIQSVLNLASENWAFRGRLFHTRSWYYHLLPKSLFYLFTCWMFQTGVFGAFHTFPSLFLLLSKLV